MTLLELGALCLALTAVLVLAGYLVRGLRWLLRIGRRIEEVLELTAQMPRLLATVEQLQQDVASVTGRISGVSQQLHAATTSNAEIAGRHGGLLVRLKHDLDTLWTRHRTLAADVASLKAVSR